VEDTKAVCRKVLLQAREGLGVGEDDVTWLVQGHFADKHLSESAFQVLNAPVEGSDPPPM
jgi:hypothetical protein